MDDDAISEITSFLATRGQTPTHIKRVMFDLRLIFSHGGVSNTAVGYKVEASSPDGSSNSYFYAWERAGWTTGERNGLKRYSNGVWFDAR